MPASAVFENIEAGASIDEIVEQFDVSREQINAVLEFAARSLAPASLPPAKASEPDGVSRRSLRFGGSHAV
jgi:hypothetical protein